MGAEVKGTQVTTSDATLAETMARIARQGKPQIEEAEDVTRAARLAQQRTGGLEAPLPAPPDAEKAAPKTAKETEEARKQKGKRKDGIIAVAIMLLIVVGIGAATLGYIYRIFGFNSLWSGITGAIIGTAAVVISAVVAWPRGKLPVGDADYKKAIREANMMGLLAFVVTLAAAMAVILSYATGGIFDMSPLLSAVAVGVTIATIFGSWGVSLLVNETKAEENNKTGKKPLLSASSLAGINTFLSVGFVAITATSAYFIGIYSLSPLLSAVTAGVVALVAVAASFAISVYRARAPNGQKNRWQVTLATTIGSTIFAGLYAAFGLSIGDVVLRTVMGAVTGGLAGFLVISSMARQLGSAMKKDVRYSASGFISVALLGIGGLVYAHETHQSPWSLLWNQPLIPLFLVAGLVATGYMLITWNDRNSVQKSVSGSPAKPLAASNPVSATPAAPRSDAKRAAVSASTPRGVSTAARPAPTSVASTPASGDSRLTSHSDSSSGFVDTPEDLKGVRGASPRRADGEEPPSPLTGASAAAAPRPRGKGRTVSVDSLAGAVTSPSSRYGAGPLAPSVAQTSADLAAIDRAAAMPHPLPPLPAGAAAVPARSGAADFAPTRQVQDDDVRVVGSAPSDAETVDLLSRIDSDEGDYEAELNPVSDDEEIPPPSPPVAEFSTPQTRAEAPPSSSPAKFSTPQETASEPSGKFKLSPSPSVVSAVSAPATLGAKPPESPVPPFSSAIATEEAESAVDREVPTVAASASPPQSEFKHERRDHSPVPGEQQNAGGEKTSDSVTPPRVTGPSPSAADPRMSSGASVKSFLASPTGETAPAELEQMDKQPLSARSEGVVGAGIHPESPAVIATGPLASEDPISSPKPTDVSKSPYACTLASTPDTRPSSSGITLDHHAAATSPIKPFTPQSIKEAGISQESPIARAVGETTPTQLEQIEKQPLSARLEVIATASAISSASRDPMSARSEGVVGAGIHQESPAVVVPKFLASENPLSPPKPAVMSESPAVARTFSASTAETRQSSGGIKSTHNAIATSPIKPFTPQSNKGAGISQESPLAQVVGDATPAQLEQLAKQPLSARSEAVATPVAISSASKDPISPAKRGDESESPDARAFSASTPETKRSGGGITSDHHTVATSPVKPFTPQSTKGAEISQESPVAPVVGETAPAQLEQIDKQPLSARSEALATATVASSVSQSPLARTPASTPETRRSGGAITSDYHAIATSPVKPFTPQSSKGTEISQESPAARAEGEATPAQLEQIAKQPLSARSEGVVGAGIHQESPAVVAAVPLASDPFLAPQADISESPYAPAFGRVDRTPGRRRSSSGITLDRNAIVPSPVKPVTPQNILGTGIYHEAPTAPAVEAGIHQESPAAAAAAAPLVSDLFLAPQADASESPYAPAFGRVDRTPGRRRSSGSITSDRNPEVPSLVKPFSLKNVAGTPSSSMLVAGSPAAKNTLSSVFYPAVSADAQLQVAGSPSVRNESPLGGSVLLPASPAAPSSTRALKHTEVVLTPASSISAQTTSQTGSVSAPQAASVEVAAASPLASADPLQALVATGPETPSKSVSIHEQSAEKEKQDNSSAVASAGASSLSAPTAAGNSSPPRSVSPKRQRPPLGSAGPLEAGIPYGFPHTEPSPAASMVRPRPTGTPKGADGILNIGAASPLEASPVLRSSADKAVVSFDNKATSTDSAEFAAASAGTSDLSTGTKLASPAGTASVEAGVSQEPPAVPSAGETPLHASVDPATPSAASVKSPLRQTPATGLSTGTVLQNTSPAVQAGDGSATRPVASRSPQTVKKALLSRFESAVSADSISPTSVASAAAAVGADSGNNPTSAAAPSDNSAAVTESPIAPAFGPWTRRRSSSAKPFSPAKAGGQSVTAMATSAAAAAVISVVSPSVDYTNTQTAVSASNAEGQLPPLENQLEEAKENRTSAQKLSPPQSQSPVKSVQASPAEEPVEKLTVVVTPPVVVAAPAAVISDDTGVASVPASPASVQSVPQSRSASAHGGTPAAAQNLAPASPAVVGGSSSPSRIPLTVGSPIARDLAAKFEAAASPTAARSGAQTATSVSELSAPLPLVENVVEELGADTTTPAKPLVLSAPQNLSPVKEQPENSSDEDDVKSVARSSVAQSKDDAQDDEVQSVPPSEEKEERVTAVVGEDAQVKDYVEKSVGEFKKLENKLTQQQQEIVYRFTNPSEAKNSEKLKAEITLKYARMLKQLLSSDQHSAVENFVRAIYLASSFKDMPEYEEGSFRDKAESARAVYGSMITELHVKDCINAGYLTHFNLPVTTLTSEQREIINLFIGGSKTEISDSELSEAELEQIGKITLPYAQALERLLSVDIHQEAAKNLIKAIDAHYGKIKHRLTQMLYEKLCVGLRPPATSPAQSSIFGSQATVDSPIQSTVGRQTAGSRSPLSPMGTGKQAAKFGTPGSVGGERDEVASVAPSDEVASVARSDSVASVARSDAVASVGRSPVSMPPSTTMKRSPPLSMGGGRSPAFLAAPKSAASQTGSVASVARSLRSAASGSRVKTPAGGMATGTAQQTQAFFSPAVASPAGSVASVPRSPASGTPGSAVRNASTSPVKASVGQQTQAFLPPVAAVASPAGSVASAPRSPASVASRARSPGSGVAPEKENTPGM